MNVNLPTTADLTVAVYNSVGQKVASRSFAAFNKGAMDFDLTAQAAGIYFLRVEADGKTIVKKISVQ